MTRSAQIYDYNIIKVLPYLFVLILAIIGINVFVVLTGGIILSGAIGMIYREFTLIGFTQEIFNGFSGMIDIFLLSMFTGGLAHMIARQEGRGLITK